MNVFLRVFFILGVITSAVVVRGYLMQPAPAEPYTYTFKMPLMFPACMTYRMVEGEVFHGWHIQQPIKLETPRGKFEISDNYFENPADMGCIPVITVIDWSSSGTISNITGDYTDNHKAP